MEERKKTKYIYPKYADGKTYILGMLGSEWAIFLIIWFPAVVVFGQAGLFLLFVLLPGYIGLFKRPNGKRESLFYTWVNKIMFILESKSFPRDPREEITHEEE